MAVKRVKMNIWEVRDQMRDYFASMGENVDTMGIMSLVDVEDMGWCKDGVTRWYHFTNAEGKPAVYYKY